MSACPLLDYSRLCIHTATTKPWNLETACTEYARAGVRGITVWRDALEACGPMRAASVIKSSDLEVVSLCRGGFFTHGSVLERQRALDDNRRAIEEAHIIGAPLIVLVCGARPGQPLSTSREQIADGIAAILPDAVAAGVKLAVEPLHPMYSGDRSAINTLKQANDLALLFPPDSVGVAVDVYHVWWDDTLPDELARCGRNKRLFAFHVCDWKLDTNHILLDRGLPGEGCIPIRAIRAQVEQAGFTGFIEVEVFSQRLWAMDQGTSLTHILHSYRNHV
ncbi:MAG: sugar phosphate isomerase/epimerase family protein [Verrucomicrobiota bacterium]|nr:sugar phosphate isomerase/epimerase family protein [Verrucomicrobiota bacterium]